MNSFIRIFGSGPIGLFTSGLLLCTAFYFRNLLDTPAVFGDQDFIRVSVFVFLSVISVTIVIWSFISLNPKLRGRTLVTTGAFRYFRHPLYAAFLTFFNFGLAVFLNNWIFIIWAILLHPVWHLLVAGEEKALKRVFPNEYEKYCGRTGRFFPRFFSMKRQ